MKKLNLKKSSYLSLALLALTSLNGVIQINANPTPATVVGALTANKQNAVDFIIKFFNGEPNDEFFVDTLVKNLATLDEAFAGLDATDAKAIIEAIYAQIEVLPESIQTLFNELGAEKTTMIINETMALDELDNFLSTKTRRDIPKWPVFVDKVTGLLEGNNQFAEFSKNLDGYRNAYGVTIAGRLIAAQKAYAHVLPKKAADQIKALGFNGIRNRIKY